MTLRNFIPIKASEVPVSFNFTIDGESLVWEFMFNERNDFYSVLIKDDNDVVIYTSKVILDNDILHAGIVLRIANQVVPRDAQTGETLRVGEDELGNPVNLYIESA